MSLHGFLVHHVLIGCFQQATGYTEEHVGVSIGKVIKDNQSAVLDIPIQLRLNSIKAVVGSGDFLRQFVLLRALTEANNDTRKAESCGECAAQNGLARVTIASKK